MFAAIALISIGLLELAGLTDSWSAIGRWYSDAGRIGSVATLLIPTVISAVVGFLVLRRATPKS